MELRLHITLTGAVVANLAALLSGTARAETREVRINKLPPAATTTVDFAKHIRPLFATACYKCHGPDKQEAGLRLDSRRKSLAGADSGPVIVPGKSAQSRLIHLVAGLDEEIGRMPPEDASDPLAADQIGLLRAWIDQGAKWPDAEVGDDGTPRSDFWSFQPIQRPEPPAVAQGEWVRNSIDAFILAKLEQENVLPSPEADRITLLRRVYIDLIGLPPAPRDVDKFLADNRADAYERVVDQILESPHYGERWGRHWLDAARYADSDGFEQDRGRPFAWRYRDWVINAVNADMPFDVFTVQQLAGDLLTKSDAEYDAAAPIATGFHRNTLLNREGGIDPEEDRVKRTIDRTNTLGTVWLGLSVGCANCHAHKYDPITQREYFGLYAFFNNLDEVDAELTSDGVATLDLHYQTKNGESKVDRTRAIDGVIAKTVPSKIEAQKEEPQSTLNPGQVKKNRRSDGAMKLAQVVVERAKPRTTHVHLRGDFLSNGPVVEPGTLDVMPPLMKRGNSPDRLDLARWLVSTENPLTARVIVNRMWQMHFGRGIVATGDDFGTQGEKPSHPPLLDWLASELQESGWRMKHLHRVIVTSATYRQSSSARPELTDRDPYNTWLARQNRLRVEAEIVRDLALSVSGLLNLAVGGPSVRPPQPQAAPGSTIATDFGNTNWPESQGADRYRRGLYIWFQRASPYASLMAFDAPEASLACTRRERSNTPLQALTMLNDVVFVECAESLGRKMAAWAEADDRTALQDSTDARIRHTLRQCLAREPSARDIRVLRTLHDDALALYCNAAKTGKTIRDNSDSAAGMSSFEPINVAEMRACVAVARAILNTDEFVTRE
jgi:hypothetical protein